jgi:TonB family protein
MRISFNSFKLSLVLIVVISFNSFAQLKDSSLYFYYAANKAVAEHKLKLADYLYTQSIKRLAHPDTYYNRAVVRKSLKDTAGYCDDIQAAANLGDSLSYNEFWINCGKIDTLYFTDDNKASKKSHAEYFTVTKHCFYTSFEGYKKVNHNGEVLLNYVINKGDTTYFDGTELTVKTDSTTNFTQYIFKNLVYPEMAKQQGIEGKVLLSVIINKFGNLESVKIIKGCPGGLNEAALKVVHEMPKWAIYTFKGQSVKKRLEIPVNFILH